MSAHIVNITEKAKTHIRRTLIDIDKEYLVFRSEEHTSELQSH